MAGNIANSLGDTQLTSDPGEADNVRRALNLGGEARTNESIQVVDTQTQRQTSFPDAQPRSPSPISKTPPPAEHVLPSPAKNPDDADPENEPVTPSRKKGGKPRKVQPLSPGYFKLLG